MKTKLRELESAVNVPVPRYGPVPPLAETVTLVVPPLHAIDPADEEADTAEGSVTVPDVTEVHPFASVTV